MCWHQASYQEGTHPRMRDWTTSMLQQAKTMYGFEIWGGSSSYVCSHSWFSKRGICPCCTRASLAHTWVCLSAACMASTATRFHLIYVQTDLDFLTPQWRCVAVRTRCTSGLLKKTTFWLSTVVPGIWTHPNAPFSPIAVGSEDQPLAFKGLSGGTCIYIFLNYFLARCLLQPNLASRDDQGTTRWRVKNRLKIQVFINHNSSFPH